MNRDAGLLKNQLLKVIKVQVFQYTGQVFEDMMKRYAPNAPLNLKRVIYYSSEY